MQICMGQETQAIGTIRFYNPNAFTGLTGVIDKQNQTIHGVSVITGDLVAEGHNLHVDNETIRQLHSLASGMGQVPVCLDHDGGVSDINGFLHNFRVDGNKLRADWCLLETHPKTVQTLEMAERMPTGFGLSAAFKGDKAGVLCNGKPCARAEALLSVDVVKRPAANPMGLFSSKVDIGKNDMADIQQQQQEPTISDLLGAIQNISQRLEQQEQFNQSVVDHLNGQQEEGGEGEYAEPTLQDLASMSDEELAQFTDEQGNPLTRQQVDQAIDQAIAQQQGQQGQQGEEQSVGVGGGVGEEYGSRGAYGPPPGGNHQQGQQTMPQQNQQTPVTAELAALRKEVVELKNRNKRIEFAEKQQAETIEFEQIADKIRILEAQRDEAIRLFEVVKAENEALHVAVNTGTRPVTAGVDNGIRLFAANGEGELHQFQVLVKNFEAQGKTEAEAIRLARKEPNGIALHADWVQSQNTTRK